jgi:hypothetical protein
VDECLAVVRRDRHQEGRKPRKKKNKRPELRKRERERGAEVGGGDEGNNLNKNRKLDDS